MNPQPPASQNQVLFHSSIVPGSSPGRQRNLPKVRHIPQIKTWKEFFPATSLHTDLADWRLQITKSIPAPTLSLAKEG